MIMISYSFVIYLLKDNRKINLKIVVLWLFNTQTNTYDAMVKGVVCFYQDKNLNFHQILFSQGKH